MIWGTSVQAQFIMDNLSDTARYQNGTIGIYQKYRRLRFSGYIQPQYQVAQTEGAPSFNGGDFAPAADNRFMLRRGRLRLDYTRLNEQGDPSVFFAFQFDGTERGVFIRDFFGRFFENKWKFFHITTGMFPRPFGYELNLSSSDRESPERGRMSQILMRTERDLGVMASFEPRQNQQNWLGLEADIGVFNGQGLTAPGEFDSYKDVVAHLQLKSVPIVPNRVSLSVGVSLLHGGIKHYSPIYYKMEGQGFRKDSSASIVGQKSPRRYYGVDAQLKIKNRKTGMLTEGRIEYIGGLQSSTRLTSETPGSLFAPNGDILPIYVRPFLGAYVYVLQHIFTPRHQLGFKYDFYDPNTAVEKQQIGDGFTGADVRFDTYSFGYNYYINENVRLLLWYDVVRNESTALKGFTSDLQDNVFTVRLQYRF